MEGRERNVFIQHRPPGEKDSMLRTLRAEGEME